LLPIGSEAGIALVGQARGLYTLLTHLKLTPVIAIGYAAIVWFHVPVIGRYASLFTPQVREQP